MIYTQQFSLVRSANLRGYVPAQEIGHIEHTMPYREELPVNHSQPHAILTATKEEIVKLVVKVNERLRRVVVPDVGFYHMFPKEPAKVQD